jgi:hypothetical protein
VTRSMPRLVLVLLALTLVAGCSRINRTSQCRELATKVNSTLDEVESKLDASTTDPSTLRDIAQRYEKLGVEVERYVKGDDGRARTMREYSNLFRDTGRVLGQLATAIEKNDLAGTAKARRDLTILGRRDKPLAARIEANCLE